jgi:hypothetical protein
MEYLCYKWPRICSVCRNHKPCPYLTYFLITEFVTSVTYHQVCSKSITTDTACGTGTVYPSGAHLWILMELDHQIKIFRSLNLNLHVFIVQSIVMVNLNIYFAYFHFVLVSLCLIKSNQVIIIMLYVYMYVVYFVMYDSVLILLLSYGHHDWFNKVFVFFLLFKLSFHKKKSRHKSMNLSLYEG